MTAPCSLLLEEDYRYCEGIIKRHSKSFYYAFSKLPKEKARAVYAIYAFCRTADDSVDASGSQAERTAALDRLTEELELFRLGQEPDTALWRALRDVFDRYDMDFRPFSDQLAGQRMDLDFRQPANLPELESYSYHVAGSVGLMLLPILAPDAGPETRIRAADLGIAMQITNILRDVGEDFRDKGRIYLPMDRMLAHGYTDQQLQRGGLDAGFSGLWEELASRAETLYDQFTGTLHEYADDSRLPVALSAGVYRGILDEVRKNGYDCMNKRAVVGRLAKEHISLAVKAGLRERLAFGRLPVVDTAP